MKLIMSVFSVLVLVTGFSWANGGAEDEIIIGVTLETFDDVFMQNVKNSVEARVAEMEVKVIIVDAKSNPAEQVKQVENFITKGVSGIIVHVINGDISSTITEKAVAADIPLVYMNRGVPEVPAGKKVAVVASPEIEAGKGQAMFVVDMLSAKGITSGNVAILLGSLGSAPQIGRTQGVKEYLSNTDFKVTREQTANWKRSDAVSVMENWLASGDEFVAVFANNDEMALGASLALQEVDKRDKVLIVGVDANAYALIALETGDMDMSMFQNGGAQGKGSVDTILKMMKGEAFNQNVIIPFEAVTKEKASDYRAEFKY